MSENPHSREHIHPVYLNTAYYIAVHKLSGNLEIGKSAGILLALNEGLYHLGVLSQEDYTVLDGRYRRKLRDVIAERQMQREPSHVPKLTLEQRRETLILEAKDKQFRGMLSQWAQHPNPEWRAKVLADAEKYKDKLQSARLLLDLGEKSVEGVPHE